MLEVFSRDRGSDYVTFVFTDDAIQYRRQPYQKRMYKGLEEGTIILDGKPLNVNEITDEQVEYIRDTLNLFKDRVNMYKETYKPVYVRYTSGNNISDIINNKAIVEVPDFKHFNEWAHITGFNHLQDFMNEYEKKNSKGFKAKIKSIFK